MRKQYNKNKSKKKGDVCTCPACGESFIKKHYQQAFCTTKGGTKCKDKYWNTVTPNKRNNTTRISPASKRFMERRENDYRSIYDDFHPYEGLNDEDYKNF